MIEDLFAQEQQCCAFRGFTFERTGAALVVEVTAPAEAGPAPDVMQTLAERNAPPEIGEQQRRRPRVSLRACSQMLKRVSRPR